MHLEYNKIKINIISKIISKTKKFERILKINVCHLNDDISENTIFSNITV